MIVLILIANIFSAIILYLILKELKKNTPQISNNKTINRNHARIAKNSFSSPLDPYDIYKDKKSQLYEPRKQGGGVRIEVDKE